MAHAYNVSSTSVRDRELSCSHNDTTNETVIPPVSAE